MTIIVLPIRRYLYPFNTSIYSGPYARYRNFAEERAIITFPRDKTWGEIRVTHHMRVGRNNIDRYHKAHSELEIL